MLILFKQAQFARTRKERITKIFPTRIMIIIIFNLGTFAIAVVQTELILITDISVVRLSILNHNGSILLSQLF